MLFNERWRVISKVWQNVIITYTLQEEKEAPTDAFVFQIKNVNENEKTFFNDEICNNNSTVSLLRAETIPF